MLTSLFILLLLGLGGYAVWKFVQRQRGNSSYMGMPPQQGYGYGPRDYREPQQYYQNTYPGNYYNGPYQQRGYPQQGYAGGQGGMNPLVAGGLGALGGGLLGYQVGQALNPDEVGATVDGVQEQGQEFMSTVADGAGADFGGGDFMNGGDFGSEL
jgi:hypothetical protein